MMWFILLPWMDNGIWMLTGIPSGFLYRLTIMVDQSKTYTVRDCSIKRTSTKGKGAKRMVTKLDIRMCHSCESLVSLLKDLCNTLHLSGSYSSQYSFFLNRVSQNILYNCLRCKLIRLRRHWKLQRSSVVRWHNHKTACDRPPTKMYRDLQMFDWERTQISSCFPTYLFKNNRMIWKR